MTSPDADTFESLQRQLVSRLEEGQGETIYEVGAGGELTFFLLSLTRIC